MCPCQKTVVSTNKTTSSRSKERKLRTKQRKGNPVKTARQLTKYRESMQNLILLMVRHRKKLQMSQRASLAKRAQMQPLIMRLLTTPCSRRQKIKQQSHRKSKRNSKERYVCEFLEFLLHHSSVQHLSQNSCLFSSSYLFKSAYFVLCYQYILCFLGKKKVAQFYISIY